MRIRRLGGHDSVMTASPPPPASAPTPDPAPAEPAGSTGYAGPAEPTDPAEPTGSPGPAGSPPGASAPGSGSAPGASAPGPTAGEVPPLTAFAWRHGLVRPVQGRTFAGVSGAFARATNTDPVLWKVVLVVLAIFGGIGVLIYLLAWLLLPADGDTATPVEALAGRGHSRTSSTRTIIGLVIAALMLAGYVSEPYRWTPLVAMVLLGGVLLLLLHDRSRGSGPVSPPPPPPAGPPPATDPWAARPGAPWAATPPGPAGPTGPFAPQGPYAPPATPPPPGSPPAVHWQRPPQPPRPRSRLGLFTLSVAVLLLGGLVAADLSGNSVPALAYFAAPLAVLGLGLVVGAWLGRARWLIPLGIVLTLALGSGYVALGNDGYWGRAGIGVITLQLDSVEDIPDRWQRDIGAIDVDMSEVDFSGTETTVEIRVGVGGIEVTVPDDVDVTVEASVGIGSATVFDEEWNGLGAGSRTVTNYGRDGVGGGELRIIASVNTGGIEIRRDR